MQYFVYRMKKVLRWLSTYQLDRNLSILEPTPSLATCCNPIAVIRTRGEITGTRPLKNATWILKSDASMCIVDRWSKVAVIDRRSRVYTRAPHVAH